MSHSDTVDTQTAKIILARLKTIQGQTHGVQRMLQEGRQCHEVIEQLLAIRAGINAILLESKHQSTVQDLRSHEHTPEVIIEDVIQFIHQAIHPPES
jgi:DNA-binding FrmR family transcriptional regulator